MLALLHQMGKQLQQLFAHQLAAGGIGVVLQLLAAHVQILLQQQPHAVAPAPALRHIALGQVQVAADNGMRDFQHPQAVGFGVAEVIRLVRQLQQKIAGGAVDLPLHLAEGHGLIQRQGEQKRFFAGQVLQVLRQAQIGCRCRLQL